MAIEFMPWYGTDQQMTRCGGDEGCGAMVMSGDTELHQKWHDKVRRPIVVQHIVPADEPREVARDVLQRLKEAPRRTVRKPW